MRFRQAPTLGNPTQKGSEPVAIKPPAYWDRKETRNARKGDLSTIFDEGSNRPYESWFFIMRSRSCTEDLAITRAN
jgi:hypothetical protein